MGKNPKLAKAYVSMAGLLYNFEYNWIDGEKYFKRAIELNPNYATGMQWYASLLRNMGKLNDSLNKLIRNSLIFSLTIFLGITGFLTKIIFF